MREVTAKRSSTHRWKVFKVNLQFLLQSSDHTHLISSLVNQILLGFYQHSLFVLLWFRILVFALVRHWYIKLSRVRWVCADIRYDLHDSRTSTSALLGWVCLLSTKLLRHVWDAAYGFFGLLSSLSCETLRMPWWLWLLLVEKVRHAHSIRLVVRRLSLVDSENINVSVVGELVMHLSGVFSLCNLLSIAL